MTFNKSRAGQILQMVNGEVWTLTADGFTYTGAYIDSGAYAKVTLTGWSTPGNNGVTFWQTASGGWIILADGWQSVGYSTAYSARSAQSYVDEIIKNNQLILQNNLVCARFANKLTSAQLAQLRGLQSRLNNRNKSLMEDGLVSVQDTSYPRGYADLANALNEVMATGGTYGIGVVVSTTVIIVVSAVVVASLATAAYFAYKAFAAESRDDVKFSKELTKTLTSKLTPEEWQQLQDETQGIVTKTRVKQTISNLGSLGSFLLTGGIVLGGLWVYNKYFKKA